MKEEKTITYLLNILSCHFIKLNKAKTPSIPHKKIILWSMNGWKTTLKLICQGTNTSQSSDHKQLAFGWLFFLLLFIFYYYYYCSLHRTDESQKGQNSCLTVEVAGLVRTLIHIGSLTN